MGFARRRQAGDVFFQGDDPPDKRAAPEAARDLSQALMSSAAGPVTFSVSGPSCCAAADRRPFCKSRMQGGRLASR